MVIELGVKVIVVKGYGKKGPVRAARRSEMWNRKYIKPPPVCELKTSLTESDIGALKKAKSILQDALQSNLLQQHIEVLTNEHYILSRFIYTVKNQFRREKSMAGFQQINSCLKRIYEMDIQTIITQLKGCMKIKSYLESTNGAVYVISKQCTEYYLVKLMGLTALLGQTGNYCRATFIQVMNHINVGHLIPKYVVLFAATSRIWYITRSLCLKVCNWYQAVKDCLPFLPPTQVPWLAEDMVLPPDLIKWLITNGFHDTNHTVDEQMAEQATTSHPESSSGGLTFNPNEEDVGEVITRRPVVIAAVDKTKDTDSEKIALSVSDTEVEGQRKVVKAGTKHKVVEPQATSKLLTCKASEDVKGHAGKLKESSEKKSSLESLGHNEVKTFLEDSFRTFKEISVFQKRVEAKELEISGVILKLSKVKAKKVLSIIQVALDSIPTDLKKSKRRKLLAEIVVPEVCSLLDRVLLKSMKT